jgi:hypothetical protein
MPAVVSSAAVPLRFRVCDKENRVPGKETDLATGEAQSYVRRPDRIPSVQNNARQSAITSH